MRVYFYIDQRGHLSIFFDPLAGKPQRNHRTEVIEDQHIPNARMTPGYKGLVQFIGKRVKHGKKPCKPGFALLHSERVPIGQGKDGVADQMSALFGDLIRPAKVWYIGRGLSSA